MIPTDIVADWISNEKNDWFDEIVMDLKVIYDDLFY